MTDVQTRVHGCLLGGAAGDALGAPVEFLSLDEIEERYGPEGIREPDEAYGRRGVVTDDTQLTLFTAEGLLRARAAGSDELDGQVRAVHHAYVRWLETQGFAVPDLGESSPRGWLVDVPEVRHRRGPGMTTVSALGSGERGTTRRPVNESKGCGGIMRVAPAGLLAPVGIEPYRLGCELAALTHGHPTGWIAAGALAHLLDAVLEGESLEEAVGATLERLAGEPDHAETSQALKSALAAAEYGDPIAETVESLGAGWVADETLGIAVYCALVGGEDVAAGLRLAVNHSGDSDSTGAVAGQIMGALHGPDAIPDAWLDVLEVRDVVTTIADDIVAARAGEPLDAARYPTG